jgi:glyoxalase family protein
MLSPITGLHHVTAIASNPQRNLNFCTEVMGLRFVKRTVNFDDPGSYHFYFGDDTGSPGTIMTFFAWPGASRGHVGIGEVSRTSFNIPLSSLEFWEQQLQTHRIAVEHAGERFDEDVLTFSDPDGMRIELVATVDARPVDAPRFAAVPPEHAIRGFAGVTILVNRPEPTAKILNVMGFHKVSEDHGRIRFAPEGNAPGGHIDLLVDVEERYRNLGAGSVHHIAFRAKDDAAQLAWKAEIEKYLNVTEVLDRTYFHSIYFREPGGVLFELATDPPGFSIDEPLESLGEELRIPAWLKPHQERIEDRLPAITLHKPLPPMELHSSRGGSI